MCVLGFSSLTNVCIQAREKELKKLKAAQKAEAAKLQVTAHWKLHFILNYSDVLENYKLVLTIK